MFSVFSIFKVRRNTLGTLQKKSASILDVFNRTVVQCRKVNEQIAQLSSKKQATANKLVQEINDLNNMSKANDKLASKIEAFLSE
jgi:hypothetical protein